ncbi:hypothetical protein [Capnocytophaga sputigena]|uniref:hypothetical protein n=1 Tax=Capnocytophaga sputigena TaxID=1019 RepID=UPI00288B2AF0|nr:hypothetical protein [Capnocytophaga sputigena]
MNINIEDFSLINFISSVETISFDYAGVGGIADCLGYYIICFKERNSDILSAISFEDILLHKELTEIANHILQTLCIPIRFGDDSHLVESTLGRPLCIDENLFTDRKIWYYYINEGKGLLSIGINLADKVMSLEIITHPTIIKERKETLSIS